jgi:mycothiol synthase
MLNGIRPYQKTDLQAYYNLMVACEQADKAGTAPSMEGMAHMLSLPGIEGEKTVHLLEGSEGLVAAVSGAKRDTHDRSVFWATIAVHPAHRTDALYDSLLAFLEDKARTTEGVTAVQSEISNRKPALERLYERSGYQAVRYFSDFVRDLTLPIEEVPDPPGITVRTLDLEKDIPDFYAALVDSFKDHWDPLTLTLEQTVHFMSRPGVMHDLIFMAFDENGVCAGATDCGIRDEFNKKNGVAEGHVDVLGVRREFRRRGVARALLTRGLLGLRDAGMDSASLDVDADSPTGANKLYASVGFTERSRSTVFEKVFEN